MLSKTPQRSILKKSSLSPTSAQGRRKNNGERKNILRQNTSKNSFIGATGKEDKKVKRQNTRKKSVTFSKNLEDVSNVDLDELRKDSSSSSSSSESIDPMGNYENTLNVIRARRKKRKEKDERRSPLSSLTRDASPLQSDYREKHSPERRLHILDSNDSSEGGFRRISLDDHIKSKSHTAANGGSSDEEDIDGSIINDDSDLMGTLNFSDTKWEDEEKMTSKT
eukprot:UN34858